MPNPTDPKPTHPIVDPDAPPDEGRPDRPDRPDQGLPGRPGDRPRPDQGLPETPDPK
jgi:hypothetical protein